MPLKPAKPGAEGKQALPPSVDAPLPSPTSKPEKRFVCRQCDQVLANQKQLTKHVREAHSLD